MLTRNKTERMCFLNSLKNSDILSQVVFVTNNTFWEEPVPKFLAIPFLARVNVKQSLYVCL